MNIKATSATSIKLLFLLILLLPVSVLGQVKLPKLIADGMVLQRDAEVKLWGWAAADEKVSVRFLDKNFQTVANSAGEWELMLPALEAGGPHRMVIEASNTISINDILIGDVWICSGQSNMELPMRRVKPLYEEEIAGAENSFIRYFSVPKTYDFNTAHQDLENGHWQQVTPENVLDFSAVAYFFSRELYEKYQIPIGLINTALGGSPAEAWMSEEALKEFPEHFKEAQRFKDPELIREIEAADQARGKAWYQEATQKDKGYQNKPTWHDPALKASDWASMELPGYWKDTELGDVNGVVWFRKDIEIPASAARQPAKLNMGRIVDADSVFVNGQFVGSTGYQYPPRWYTIPEGVLKEGKNTIVVRVINESGHGGFVLDKPYELKVAGQTIDLTGEWKYRLGAEMEPLTSQTFIRWKPLGLYNAMISPLLNYRIKGVIWYQGESNVDEAAEYFRLFPAMIQDWRQQWNQGDFPFLFVQLANFMEAKEQPTESDWALLREAQRKTLALPNTGMAVAIDVGEWNDIHPLNKEYVGLRLALAAQKVAYGEELVFAGPEFESMEIKGNKVILSFKNYGSGLQAKGGDDLKHFAIAGADKKFVWANAQIKGNKVVVWSEKVAKPVAVRYAWADNPEGANLYNKEGLPASPFTTDELEVE